jgi:hypothetical protein
MLSELGFQNLMKFTKIQRIQTDFCQIHREIGKIWSQNSDWAMSEFWVPGHNSMHIPTNSTDSKLHTYLNRIIVVHQQTKLNLLKELLAVQMYEGINVSQTLPITPRNRKGMPLTRQVGSRQIHKTAQVLETYQ